MPSITTEYNGRLCNQIIRNLCVSFIAKKHNLLVQYSNFDKIVSLGIELFVGKNDYNDTIQLIDENYFEILNNDFLFNNIDPNTRHFQIKEIMDMIYLYLQSNDVKNNIIKYNLFKDKYNNNNDCSIHIRLTDAENNNPGIEYYLKVLKLCNFDNLYIYSDNTNHQIIKDILNVYKNATILDFDEIKTIQFASTCKYVILSHGSFSAIIGYLSFYSNVYYPKYEIGKMWYGDMFSIPSWIMIDKNDIYVNDCL
jgi:hypothetical protein